MYLTLEVVSANAASLGPGRRKVFTVDGGRIGRSPDSDMVLKSPGVHRHHATVRFINGVFFVEGVGTNGIAVNNAERILPRNEPYPLKTGDKLYIDEYELAVTVSATAPEADPPPAAVHSGLPPLTELTGPPPSTFAPLAESLGEPVDDLDPLRHLNARESQRQKVPEPAWNHSSALMDHFAPPPVQAAAVETIPEDWDKTTFNKSKLEPPPSPFAPPRPAMAPQPAMPSPPVMGPLSVPAAVPSSGSGAFSWEDFLRAAGVDPATVPEDTSAALGHILRTVVQGLIEVLRARSEIKNQFRLPVTQVKVSENNPLKFAANAEDALNMLFGRRNPAYLPPREAFDDAFNDVRFHQLAMLAGVRAGFESLMSRFDPQRLQEMFDRRGSRGLFGGSKAKYWDSYVDLYREMVADSDNTFRRLFGEEFARAYEQQLAVLKRSRGGAGR